MALLEVRDLTKYFPIRQGLLQREVAQVRAIDGISFDVERGETFGLVGESGCGKSTLGRTLLQIYPPTKGTIQFGGNDFSRVTRQKRKFLTQNMQMIFQDPAASLDPRMTVGQCLAEPFAIQGILSRGERLAKVQELLKTVGLKPEHAGRFPHEFSGGQKQRICIARALALSPSLIICDEPVSALDVSIQAQILNLLGDLQTRLNLTYLFISHDLGIVEHLSTRVAVMYLGKIVEIGETDALFQNPRHPYTQALMRAVPRAGKPKNLESKALKGEVPSPINPPPGCAFHPRCPLVIERCKTDVPPLLKQTDIATSVACHVVNHQQNPKFEKSFP